MNADFDPFASRAADSPAEAAERVFRRSRWDDFNSRIAPGARPTWDDILDGYIMRTTGQGIWLDAIRIRKDGLSQDVAFSVLVTENYDEEPLTGDFCNYAYPKEGNRNTESHIEGLKAAQALQMPIFLIDGLWRPYTVRVAFVVAHDDASRLFLITWNSSVAKTYDFTDDKPYEHVPAKRKRRNALVLERPGHARFKFETFHRYGPRCAFCDVSLPALLNAAHIRPVAYDGSDDPRNGLVLCVLHHTAFDCGIIRINPATLSVELPHGVRADQLQLQYDNLHGLTKPVAGLELEWRYTSYLGRTVNGARHATAKA